MIAAQRHDVILRELRLRGTLTIAEFSERIGVSTITLRRDLIKLEDEQKLVRVHGGAKVLRQRTSDQNSRRERTTTTIDINRRAQHDPPTATVGMIVPTNGYYYAELIEGAKAAAALADVRLTLAISGYQPSKELELLNHMISLELDGVLITPGNRNPQAEVRDAIERCPIPVTVVERVWEYPTGSRAIDSVRSDHAHGAELAVRHLSELGHRNLALWTMHNPHHHEIIDGFGSAAQTNGCREITVDFDLSHPDWNPHDLQANARRYLTEICERGATAVVVYPDDFALSIVQAAPTIGIQIPADLSVVAYDDEIAELAELPLTAVAPPKRAIGFAAIDACLRRLAHGTPLAPAFPAQRIRLLPDLRVRDSTAAHPSIRAGALGMPGDHF